MSPEQDHGMHDSGSSTADKDSMDPSKDMLCYWSMGKCTVSKPYLAAQADLPMSWAMCTGKNVPDAPHAMGWDCGALALSTALARGHKHVGINCLEV
jgi:hypothetical protein